MNHRAAFLAASLIVGCSGVPSGDDAGNGGGSTAGGSTSGGSTSGGSTAGGSTAGGSTAGGSTAGGSTAGGSTAGGSTAGGSTAGGSTAGGSTAGGSTAGGSTAGGSTAGGSTAGGSTAGGTVVLDGGYSIPPNHPRILINGPRLTELQNFAADAGSAVTRFRQTVDSAVSGGNVYGFSSWNAALWRHVSGSISYCTWAVSNVDAYVTSEEVLISGNMRATVAGDSYLEVGDFIGNLALVYDWCHAQTTPAQRTRWVTYANQAVWNVWNHMQARWGTTVFAWSGWSVDNPVNNYYYSFLRATVLLGLATYGENTEAPRWLNQFRNTKIQGQLVPIFLRDLQGGGSREGTGYGTAMRSLFELYDLWESTTGERIADLTPHARQSSLYLIHSVTPTLDRLAPIGDHARDSSAALFDYHRGYALTLAKLYRGTPEAGALVDFTNRSSVPQVTQLFQRWVDFMYQPAQPAKPLGDLWNTYHGLGTGHVFARSGWTSDATWLHFTAGPYTESHAHRDQGQLLLFKREWLGFDANMVSRSGINQDEEFHNLVRLRRNTTILRQRESAGPSQLYGLVDDAAYLWTAGNLAPSYNAADGVSSLEREVLFIKPNVVVVFDRVATAPAATAEWLFSSPLAPMQSNGGATVTFAGTQSTLVARRIHPATATTTVATWPNISSDTSSGHRLTWTNASGSPFLVVLSMDGAVSNAVPADMTGQRGVDVTLANGSSFTVRFGEITRGGSLELRAPGQPNRTVTLTPQVMALPAFRVP